MTKKLSETTGSPSLELNLPLGEFVVLIETKIDELHPKPKLDSKIFLESDFPLELAVYKPAEKMFSKTVGNQEYFAFAKYMALKNYLLSKIQDS